MSADPGRPVDLWNRFWHQDAPSWPLGLFRLLFGVALWREVTTSQAKNLFAVAGGFHLPFFEWLPLVDASTYAALHRAQYPLIVLLGLGLFSRWAAGGLLLLQGYIFFSDQLNFRNHPYFFLLLLLILTLASADESVSVTRLWRRWRGKRAGAKDSGASWLAGAWQPRTWQRLIQVEVCLVYVYAGIHKLNPAYLDGEVMQRSFARFANRWREDWIAWWGEGRAERVAERVTSLEFAVAPAWISVLLELILPVLLWIPRVRWVALAVGVGFHLTIAVTMNI